MASLLIGPTGRNPHYALGEHQYAHIIGAQTAVLVAHGNGFVHNITCGVKGTLVKFYDTPTGGTTDATTLVATFDISTTTPTLETGTLDEAFSKGITVIVTGDTTTEVNISFDGAQTTNPRQFGTVDANPGR